MARPWLYAVGAVVTLGLVIGAFLGTDPLAPLGLRPPPIEALTVERTVLDDDGIELRVRAGGSAPIRIAQVQVDGAYWRFSQSPSGPLARLQTATIRIPYPWVENEAHHLVFVTNTGVTFEHTIDVAQATPLLSLSVVLGFGLLGLYIGVVPVALGLLFYPFLRTLGAAAFDFLLALTIGLLAFLLVDTLGEGLELAAGAAAAFQGEALVWLSAAMSFLVLLAVGRRTARPPDGVTLAAYIALGIGLHNLGEGLAVGAAFAVGEAALGSFLVVGFTLHNLTEGIAIASPLVRVRPPLRVFVALAALAGLPAVAGTWVGAFAFSPHWGALFLGIGAGAILQVIVEVGRYLMRAREAAGAATASVPAITGFAAGLAVMYATAFLVKF